MIAFYSIKKGNLTELNIVYRYPSGKIRTRIAKCSTVVRNYNLTNGIATINCKTFSFVCHIIFRSLEAVSSIFYQYFYYQYSCVTCTSCIQIFLLHVYVFDASIHVYQCVSAQMQVFYTWLVASIVCPQVLDFAGMSAYFVNHIFIGSLLL